MVESVLRSTDLSTQLNTHTIHHLNPIQIHSHSLHISCFCIVVFAYINFLIMLICLTFELKYYNDTKPEADNLNSSTITSVNLCLKTCIEID